MFDTQSQLIGLLERLSVIAPKRCKGMMRDYFGGDAVQYHVFLTCHSERWYTVFEFGLRHSSEDVRRADILMAVLEEAEARGWEWNYDFSKGWELLGDDLKYFEVGVVFGGILEREVLPRLSCLVLALESQQ